MADAPYKHIALITGAGTGIGRDLALYLAQKGYRVYASMRKPERRAQVEEAAREAGVAEHIRTLNLDVNNPDDVTAAYRMLTEEEQSALAGGARLSLINNAGYGIAGAVEELSIDEYRGIMETNYFGVVALTKAFLPFLREHKNGRIIQISSGFGRFGVPLMSAYNASKFALEGFSEALRYEMLPFNVFVSLIEPGPVKTEFNVNMAEGPQGAGSPYEKLYKRADQVVASAEGFASESRDVSKMVQKACEARYPSLRYEVGLPVSAARVTTQLVPQGWIEGIYRFV